MRGYGRNTDLQFVETVLALQFSLSDYPVRVLLGFDAFVLYQTLWLQVHATYESNARFILRVQT